MAAINTDIKNIPTVVFNLDGRADSRALIERFVNTGYVDIRRHAATAAEVEAAIIRGEAKVGLKIPRDYSDRLLAGEETAVQVLIDGSDSTVAMQALNVSNAVVLRASVAELAGVGGWWTPAIESRAGAVQSDMRTANFMVPGLWDIILQISYDAADGICDRAGEKRTLDSSW